MYILYKEGVGMPGDYIWKDRLPVAPLKIVALDGCKEFANLVDQHIVEYRKKANADDVSLVRSLNYSDYDKKSYLIDAITPRFGTGEGKALINESTRGCDLYIMVDVTNHSIEYTVNGHTNYMSPDDHFQNLKRVIAASAAHAKRINVVMPFLYESRQHKRSGRESLDCAIALEELYNMGVHNVITYDAHDPRVQNATPLSGFDNFMPTYQFVKTIFNNINDIIIDKDHLMCISPDEGAMDRAVYLANNLEVDMGMFYKRRDYSRVVNGRNPIVAHEFLGTNVQGKDVIIVDDMLSSGESMLDTAKALKQRLAKRVIVCTTFGLFTNGLDAFDKAYQDGTIDYVITTNLNYRNPELLTRKWYLEADMSRNLAAIINSFNHDAPVSVELSPTYKIQNFVHKRIKDKYEYIGSII